MNNTAYQEALQDSMAGFTFADSNDIHQSVDSDDDLYVHDSELEFTTIDVGNTSFTDDGAELSPVIVNLDKANESTVNKENMTEKNGTKEAIAETHRVINESGDQAATVVPMNTQVELMDIEQFDFSKDFIPTEPIDSAEDPTSYPNWLNNEQPMAHYYHSNSKPKDQEQDLMHRIKGLYRLLDIYGEEGTGGIVDKIIIDQESSGKLINHLSPGAYRNLTKVDFKAMDKVDIKPVGLYGSKNELIRFFKQLKVIDDDTETLLGEQYDTSRIKSTLRPGLYALVVQSDTTSDPCVYIVFWPEEKTWDDDASSSVCKNRTTFMRYLTKLADQIIVVISKEHGRKLSWENSEAAAVDEADSLMNEDFEESDRLFDFEVSKAIEQEESVQMRDGFSIKSSFVGEYAAPNNKKDPIIDVKKMKTRLVSGDCSQALLKATYTAPMRRNGRFNVIAQNDLQLKRYLFQSGKSLRLGRSLSFNAILVLIELGLKDLYNLSVSSFLERVKGAEEKCESDKRIKLESVLKGMQLESSEKRIRLALKMRLLNLVLMDYPKLGSGELYKLLSGGSNEEMQRNDEDFLTGLLRINPNLGAELDKSLPLQNELLRIMTSGRLTNGIKKVFICDRLFSSHELSIDQQAELWRLVSKGIDEKNMNGAVEFCNRNGMASTESRGMFHKFIPTGVWGFLNSDLLDGPVKDAANAVAYLKPSDFLREVDGMVEKWPTLADGAMEVLSIAQENFSEKINSILKSLPHRIAYRHTEFLKDRIKRECEARLDLVRVEALNQLFTSIEEHYASEQDSPQTLVLQELEVRSQASYGNNLYYNYLHMNRTSYRCSGYDIVQTPPSITYGLRLLDLLEEDKQRMQSDARYIPRPQFRSRSTYQFTAPADSEIRHIQLLPKKKCLLILEDNRRNFDIYLESLENLSNAVLSKRPKKHIHGERLGQNAVTAYDETKRTLVVCTSDIHKPSLQIHTFIFDEAFTSLLGQGSPIELAHWYNEMPHILSIHIVPSTGELALVETRGRVRVFSPVTQQFRPSILELPGPPIETYSSPDGACLVTVFNRDDGQLKMQVYHWTSLGSREGFAFDLPLTPQQIPIISSLGERKNVQLIWICVEDKACNSLGLEIKCQVTEYQFVEKGENPSSHNSAKKSFHNSLVDCHPDVWNRFPVVPAIRREIFSSGNSRRNKLLLFATDADVRFPLTSYFRDLVVNFEKVAKKPTDRVLKDIAVQQNTLSTLFSDIYHSDFWNGVSTFKAGEWMVEFFCLIPIHIAIARDNRFIPLKDGVWSPGEEKALLGANINQVADSLSFGWYESILQSYMSSKPVKVVSSMGEQSVGKSFALNHLTDTSFAGSAMRTTEGVWMSVTPTDSELIISLDFEGVHSIERSAQEDTLLVLFNAAISNLVLFRNNFALSREITTLFQSFQSSSSVLDPNANPTLFQATLDIIIKDVVDSDRIEIKREFELKLRQIVQEEQAANFISKLYRNNVRIIPWPVIESRQFHTLFSSLRRQLEKQVPTHEGGGKFLAKLKMLMAKLKTNDWGALSQNMSVYRAQQLLSFIPNALMYGASEVEPYIDPLKNLDTSEIIEMPDSDVFLWLESRGSNPSNLKEEALSDLIKRWPDFESRSQQPDKEWMGGLTSFIQTLVEQKIAHVQAWINANISQQTTTNSSVEELWRTLDSKIVELKRNVEICALRCENCRLLCVKARFHTGDHDCRTDHKCPNSCQFVDEHNGVIDKCSLGAGHDGFHICDPTAHLCGHPCDLNDKKGCQRVCTKVANHEESEHMCSVKRHLCGKPCSLRDIRMPDGGLFSCQNYCSIEWDEAHDLCVCDASNACPIACQLCGRLCSSTDHLHGLEQGVAHLCGQEHSCTSLCGSAGECEVDTVPQSIEATFNGAHDRFQYTKYSQVTKRLRCAMTIAPGALSHDGPHIHSLADEVFHYCDVRCANCGYVCTLPHGHTQPEHATSHGSMSKTRWAIDGPNETIFELDGHKFGSNDDGAPMLCSLLCSNLGRHVHIDYCRSADTQSCNEEETNHIHSRVEPDPDRAKDWITHKLYWQRLGFRDPYSREEQNTFAKCDAMCSGQEHQATATNAAQPSYCTQPMFHRSATQNSGPPGGHVSNDGHTFVCKNPAALQQAYHVIFVIDRSSSMTMEDRRPLVHHPAYETISAAADNRLGAVFSALHSFWSARAAASNAAPDTGAERRDAYSVILFDRNPVEVVRNDFTRSPDQLLSEILPYGSGMGTSFNRALASAEQVMQTYWSTERAPVIIFLSDGECSVRDDTINGLCWRAANLGKALSFHAVSFGPDGYSQSLRRMVTIAQEVQRAAPRDPLNPVNATSESSYSIALDSIRLAETFLGFADSLRKTRGGLISH